MGAALLLSHSPFLLLVLAHSSHQRTSIVRLPSANSGVASNEPAAGASIVPVEPIKKFLRYAAPAEIVPSCILLLSVGVYQRKLGGLGPFAALINVVVETGSLSKIFPLLKALEYATNGK